MCVWGVECECVECDECVAINKSSGELIIGNLSSQLVYTQNH